MAAAVVALHPDDAFEVRLALRIVAMDAAIREKQLAEKHSAAMERAGYSFKEIVLPDPAPSAAAQSDVSSTHDIRRRNL